MLSCRLGGRCLLGAKCQPNPMDEASSEGGGGWAGSTGLDVPGNAAEILSQLPERWHRCPLKDIWPRRPVCWLAAKRENFMISVTQGRRE